MASFDPNSTDLNQPYLHLVIQSIIDKCGDDFHICLIDDESFSKLIPSWNVDITNMADPHKQLFRIWLWSNSVSLWRYDCP